MESTPVTMVTVSSDLFGDLPVQLILRLLPLQVGISALPADSSNAVDPEEDTQGLLRTPGSSVPGKTRQLTFLVQSSLMKGFGSALQLLLVPNRNRTNCIETVHH
ncbi:unnamed protein product [Boreogadus saida]